MNEELYHLMANDTAVRAYKANPDRRRACARQALRELDRRLAAQRDAALKATPHS